MKEEFLKDIAKKLENICVKAYNSKEWNTAVEILALIGEIYEELNDVSQKRRIEIISAKLKLIIEDFETHKELYEREFFEKINAQNADINKQKTED